MIKGKTVFLTVCVVAILMTLVVPAEIMAQAGVGHLAGTIYKDDLKTPAQNAVVKIRNLQTREEYESKPSDDKGVYSIAGIKEGRYNLGITAAEGNFNFEYEFFIKGNETAKLVIALKRDGALPMAVATMLKKGFFATPLGIATLVLASGGVLTAGVVIASPGASPAKSPVKK